MSLKRIRALTAQLNAFYSDVCHHDHDQVEAIDITPWEKVIEQILRDTWEGKIKPGELSSAHIARTYQEINGGLWEGLGSLGHTAENELPDQSVIRMQQNIYKFSAAKDAAMLIEINNLMYDGKGNLVSFTEFKARVDKLNIKYNKNWLEAEYRTARQSGHNAQFWYDIQGNDLYPNLKYKTQEDDRVRPEHVLLDNIIRPINDPFWDEYYPPNGWRCRCYTIQTAEDPTKDENMPVVTDKDVKPEFRMNVGKSGQVFNEDSKTGHRFFALKEESPDWQKRFELSKLEAGFNTVKTSKGNKVKVSIYADEKDLQDNLKSAVKATDQLSLQYEVRPDIRNGWANPEYKINGLIADRYAGKFKNGIIKKRAQIKKFIKQYNNQFPDNKISIKYAIHFDLTGQILPDDLARNINGELKQGENLMFLIIEYNEKMVLIRKEDSYETIKDRIDALKSKKD